jgi:lipopolysaccharide heptosyltransferase II
MREDEHEVDRYMDLVAAVGARRVIAGEAKTFIHLTNEERAFAQHFLEDGNARANRSIVGFQPGTSPAMRWKQWPIERYREVISRMVDQRPDTHIVLFGSALEQEMISEMARGISGRISLAAGKTSVKQAAALIEKCDLMVCNDSGLMHAAVAVGTPVVAIYGPTDIRRTAPLGEGHTVIRHELPCSPCFKLEGDDQVHACPHHDCLMTITAEEVFNAITRKLKGSDRGAQLSARSLQSEGSYSEASSL